MGYKVLKNTLQVSKSNRKKMLKAIKTEYPLSVDSNVKNVETALKLLGFKVETKDRNILEVLPAKKWTFDLITVVNTLIKEWDTESCFIYFDDNEEQVIKLNCEGLRSSKEYGRIKYDINYKKVIEDSILDWFNNDVLQSNSIINKNLHMETLDEISSILIEKIRNNEIEKLNMDELVQYIEDNVRYLIQDETMELFDA